MVATGWPGVVDMSVFKLTLDECVKVHEVEAAVTVIAPLRDHVSRPIR